MKKKLLTSGVLWAYGLACVATNQKDQECKNVLANPVQTQAPVVIQDDSVRYIETEDGFRKLTRVIDMTEDPTIKPTVEPTKKPVVSKKNNASEPTKKPTSKQQKQNKTTTKLYTNIPLSARFQKYIDGKCKSYGISTNVVMGCIRTESNFQTQIMGDNGKAYGLMQVQKQWHKARMKKVGATDLLNPYDNVSVGIDYLAELYKIYDGNWHKTLMAYNGGHAYCKRRLRMGLTNSPYSRRVMNYAEDFKKERND